MTTPQPNKKVRSWLVEPMPAVVAKSIERLASAADVRHVVVLPDVHLAHDVCIGTVLATSRLIYPGAVGGDIGCGMAAVRFDAEADLLDVGSGRGAFLWPLLDEFPDLSIAAYRSTFSTAATRAARSGPLVRLPDATGSRWSLRPT